MGHLPCGHEVDNVNDYIGIEFQDYIVDRGDMENGGGIGTVSMPVCKACLPKYLKEFHAKVTKEVGMEKLTVDEEVKAIRNRAMLRYYSEHLAMKVREIEKLQIEEMALYEKIKEIEEVLNGES